MANTFKVITRAAATTSASTVYTVPSSTTTLVNSIVVTNTSSAGSYTILFNDVALASATAIAANDAVTIDLKQVLGTGQTIKTSANATTINFHISGLEITA